MCSFPKYVKRIFVMKKIVIDTLGGDNGALPLIEGTADYMVKHGGITPVLVGNQSLICSVMNKRNVAREEYEVIDTNEYISNEQQPMCIFGGCNDSSMALALEYLRDNDCAGLISSGNTGALLIGTICRLGLVKGLRRPALSTALPNVSGGYTCLVDCGANVDCPPADLLGFAKMGAAFMTAMYGTSTPRIASLSTGAEKGKGNKSAKETYELLEGSSLNFVGNVEGNDVMMNKADVIVCDGFAGNVILKNTEATGKIAAAMAKAYLESKGLSCGCEVYSYLNNEFDFNSRGGATFLGTKKTVVKMHGAANSSTAVSCIEQVMRLSESGFDTAIESALS